MTLVQLSSFTVFTAFMLCCFFHSKPGSAAITSGMMSFFLRFGQTRPTHFFSSADPFANLARRSFAFT
jgi:hypothetical protein